MMLVAGAGFAALAVTSPYRLRRIMAFLDPWADYERSGFQLAQSLIAIGRGEWFGVGLGGSVQKLFYLPEAHTDFLFAVLAEELGLVRRGRDAGAVHRARLAQLPHRAASRRTRGCSSLRISPLGSGCGWGCRRSSTSA